MSDPFAVLLTDYWFLASPTPMSVAYRPLFSKMPDPIAVLLTDDWFLACPFLLKCCLPTTGFWNIRFHCGVAYRPLVYSMSDPIAELLTDDWFLVGPTPLQYCFLSCTNPLW
ncbi:hypothetical protein DPMN_171268 [Dreissena polymorpha]|uniref:Uncharacterized protein n=1 Tax=Dreissena polymorpha TaxID=45954 RepID=A0A9D4DXR7_DREPO|nr:hypothetical protein DPMN_171268 [Dreissena polymorpha]